MSDLLMQLIEALLPLLLSLILEYMGLGGTVGTP